MRKAVLHLSQSDPVMRAIIERVGPCRMEYGDPEFHSLAEAIRSFTVWPRPSFISS